ncbi:MAG TPA: ABC transporter ATP-binding protein [Anaerolineae bacterium]|nr:ABC transporter ATP-binding protein [Anaerolineae bacterium]
MIRLDNVTKSFATANGRLHVLDGINLDIRPGEFVSIVGPSGCGKSTLLRLAAALDTPTHGQIRLNGQPPRELRARKEIGWMAQKPALLPWRTILDNVRLPQQVNRQALNRPAASPESLLEMMGLADFAAAYPPALSGGMQQRAALARTLATDAAVWLMDEPFSALDELTRQALADEMLAIWQKFRPTILWVTHHIPEAVKLSDRLALLTQRPSRISGIVPVDLPRPRDDTSAAFQAVVRQARAILQKGGGVTSDKQP